MVNHSGGCPGADMAWENEGKKYGVTTIAYSFPRHVHDSKTPRILTPDELQEGWDAVKLADKSLDRNLSNIEFNIYVRNLLSRNWFQVKNSEAVFAVGSFTNEHHTHVNGGTGWAVQMAMDSNKPIYFYDQGRMCWYQRQYLTKPGFIRYEYVPKLTPNFAGIGTRALEDSGLYAIKSVLANTFNSPVML